MVPTANGAISFSVTGPGEVVATDNGDPMHRTVFSSPQPRSLQRIGARHGSGAITVTATSQGLSQGTAALTAE